MSNNTNQSPTQMLPPTQVPFSHPNYTYADRERELVLLDHLLTKQYQDNRMELAFIRQQIFSGDYLTANTASAPADHVDPPEPGQVQG